MGCANRPNKINFYISLKDGEYSVIHWIGRWNGWVIALFLGAFRLI